MLNLSYQKALIEDRAELCIKKGVHIYYLGLEKDGFYVSTMDQFRNRVHMTISSADDRYRNIKQFYVSKLKEEIELVLDECGRQSSLNPKKNDKNYRDKDYWSLQQNPVSYVLKQYLSLQSEKDGLRARTIYIPSNDFRYSMIREFILSRSTS